MGALQMEDCSRILQKKNEVIIVGAGVAGAALACALGKDGRQVLVIERDLTEPNRIIGELLQPGGYLKLVELGLEESVADIDAQEILGYIIHNDGRHIKVPYPLQGFDSNVTGKSFHNGRFVQRLRNIAASLPNVTFEQGTVKSLLKENGIVKGVEYKTRHGQEMTAYASLTITCDGCFSRLRNSLCNAKVKMLSYLYGWTMDRNYKLPYSNYGHIILADSSGLLIYPISSTETRCFVDFTSAKVLSNQNGEMSQYLKTVIVSQIPPEFHEDFISSIDKGNIKKVPTWGMSARHHQVPGAILLGDALDMRHPLIGGGMMVALSDVVLLQDLLRPLRNLNDASAVCRHLQPFYTLRKPMAGTINPLATVVHKFFCVPPGSIRMELRQACFGFLCNGHGGSNVSTETLALVAGLNPLRVNLIRILCLTAIGVFSRLLLPFPSPRRLMVAARIVWGAATIILAAIKGS